MLERKVEFFNIRASSVSREMCEVSGFLIRLLCIGFIIVISKEIFTKNTAIVTTDYILNEVYTLLLTDIKAGYHRIKKFNEWIFKKQLVQIEWINKQRFILTKELFLKVSKDKRWSFTDCTSYIVMKDLKIKKVFTFDNHFKQMGFEMLEYYSKL